MYYITQLIYIRDGQEAVFNAFEAVAIPVISKYKGQLLLRLRPDATSIIESGMEVPYEMHLVVFESREDFEAFTTDPERKQFLHLKQQSIRSSLLIGGHVLM